MKALYKIVGMITLVAILGLAGISTVAAQELGSEWESLAAGDTRWVSFEYLGDGSQIEIRMYVDAVDTAAFSVWTPEQLRLMAAGKEVEPVGRGSVDPYTGCCLVWSGSLGEGGTYQVALEGVGTGTAYYQLEITGASVSVPEAASEVDEPETGETAQAAAGTVASDEVTANGITGGTGPHDALAAGQEYVSLAAGETLWYSFTCAGDGSEVAVWLDAEPDDSIAFSIWTEEQVRQWAAGEEVSPVGRGTANKYEAGDMFWAGSFCIAGEYYVVVENGSAADSSFQLGVSGDVSP